jgi:predicted amidophosphoribosyltransferase
MNEYRCSSCDARAYSSANPATVGACPRCSAPLASPAVVGHPLTADVGQR